MLVRTMVMVEGERAVTRHGSRYEKVSDLYRSDPMEDSRTCYRGTGTAHTIPYRCRYKMMTCEHDVVEFHAGMPLRYIYSMKHLAEPAPAEYNESMAFPSCCMIMYTVRKIFAHDI